MISFAIDEQNIEMILKDRLKEIVLAQSLNIQLNDQYVTRQKAEKILPTAGFAIIISGIRRCGKSTLLLNFLKNTTDPKYFNFEDPRAASFDISDFERLESIFEENNNKSEYLFFDEIQNIENWEKYIRNSLDKHKIIFITGSNASLLSKELGTRLTGRHIRYELFPFSYPEFLDFMAESPGIESFNEYFEHGGFPAYLKTKNIKILQELFTDIIIRDIVVRHGIRNSREIQDIALYLLSNVAKEFSFNSLKKISNLGSVNSVIAYLSHLEDSYLLFSVPKFDYSLKKQMANPKKIYAIDSGLINATTLSFSSDKGRILENIIFISLRADEKTIFYYKNKGECDFVIKDREKIVSAIQVCYELTEFNQERELNGLMEAMNEFDLKEAFIITYNQEDKFIINNLSISIVPAWKWLIINKNA
jgi:predicted AAA+ superfamily ATPase